MKADKNSPNLAQLLQASRAVNQATAEVVASTISGKSQIEDTGRLSEAELFFSIMCGWIHSFPPSQFPTGRLPNSLSFFVFVHSNLFSYKLRHPMGMLFIALYGQALASFSIESFL